MSDYNERRKKYINSLEPEKQLAIFLHSKLCHNNHNDMCGWFYEIRDIEDDWSRYEHQHWLSKAREFLTVTNDIELIKQIISKI